MDIRETKSHLRAAITQRLERMSQKDREAESRSLCRRIEQSLPAPPLTIAAFVSVRDEVDLKPLLQTLLDKGYALFLPRFEGGPAHRSLGGGGKMAFRQSENLADLTPGQFGIPEPQDTAALLDPSALSIALVPARAFNRKGERLGRGNGGFDIWIRAQRAANPQTQFWGVCFESQLVDEIPMETHDERVDAIITARGKTEATH